MEVSYFGLFYVALGWVRVLRTIVPDPFSKHISGTWAEATRSSRFDGFSAAAQRQLSSDNHRSDVWLGRSILQVHFAYGNEGLLSSANSYNHLQQIAIEFQLL